MKLRGEPAVDLFVSSFTTELSDLRRELYLLGREYEREVWVAEFSEPWLIGKEPIELADRLLQNIRRANGFFAILGGNTSGQSRGTPIRVGEKFSRVSFFEIEIFQAALLQKPIQLFILENYEPDEVTAAFLEILFFALPAERFRMRCTQQDVITAAAAFLRRKPARFRFPMTEGRHVRALVSQMFQRRATASGSAASPARVLFLDHRFPMRGGVPDREFVEQLLKENAETIGHEKRLARLWLSVRELMLAPPDSGRGREFLPLWDRLLDAWWAAAAWYGLHGHLYLGQLAAVCSRAQIRERLRASSIRSPDGDGWLHPGGPIASALYSIGGLLPDRRSAHLVWNMALREVQEEAKMTGAMNASNFSMRGNLLLRLKRPFDAVEDFQRALALREQEAQSSSELGGAMAELGAAWLACGRIFRGRKLIEEGLRLLESHSSPEHIVLISRRLAKALFLTGHPFKAREVQRKAIQLAHERQMFDQLRKMRWFGG